MTQKAMLPFKSIGKSLSEERERRDYSPQEVARLTRIPLLMVQALERGDEEALPTEVHVRGYIKSYVQFLGIDPDEFMSHFGIAPIDPTETAIQPLISVSPPPINQWTRVLAVIIVLVLFVLVLFLVMRPENTRLETDISFNTCSELSRGVHRAHVSTTPCTSDKHRV